MDTSKIVESMQAGVQMTRQDLCRIAMEVDSSFNESRLRSLVDKMVKDGQIMRTARDCYMKAEGDTKHVYEPVYSEEGLAIIERLKRRFPLLDFQVWELRCLNEFLNHQIWANTIFIDVEKCGTGWVFEELYGDYKGNILLKPDDDQVYLYCSNGSLIVSRLVSEAPHADEKGVTPLERIMVDLVGTKILRHMMAEDEIPNVIREMFNKYRVNQSALMRYARRRHKGDRMLEILGKRIDVRG